MSRAVASAALVVASAAGLCAQSVWQVEGRRAQARVVGAERAQLLPGALRTLGAGAFDVHFPSNADGKPRSLHLEVADGDAVVIGVGDAGPARRRPFALGDGAEAQVNLATPRGEALLRVQTAGDADARDYRLSARVRADGGLVALVGRYSEHGCYLLVLDPDAGEVRLERLLGGDRFVVRRAALPDRSGDGSRTLTLQVQGFRIDGLVDDAPLVRSFDGAISEGAPGVAWTGAQAPFEAAWLEPPVAPLGSLAVVQSGQRAALVAAVAQPPGSLAVVELVLDRPHAWIPRSPGGFELWLRQPLAAPVVAWGDWRGSLGEGTIGEVGFDGLVRANLRWPDLPALRLHAALARIRCATPDGGPIVGTSPAARVVF